MPIFQKVIFPALHADLHGSDSRSARYLAGFAQLLYKSPSCMEQLPEEMRSEFGLLLEAVRLDQNDKSTIGRLLSVMRSHFEYALHELPAGVLYAYDGATIEECDLMLTELAHYERLVSNLGGGDEHNEDLNLILELRFHIPAYQRYLSELTNHYDYETFLASQEQSAHETDE